jgi:AcrR family transcriptional regulator
MPVKKIDKDYILQESFKLFRNKSFYNTSMSDIAEACGIQKGSLYHYFSSKEALMIEVIKLTHNHFKEKIFSIAYADDIEELQRAEKMFQRTEEMFIRKNEGNLIGNIGIETARIYPEFAPLIQEFYKDWKAAIQYIIKDLVEARLHDNVVELVITEIEGALTLMRIFKDPGYLKRANARIYRRFSRMIKQNN